MTKTKYACILTFCLYAIPANAEQLSDLKAKALDCTSSLLLMTNFPDPQISRVMINKEGVASDIYGMTSALLGHPETDGQIGVERYQRARALGLLWDRDRPALHRLVAACDSWINVVGPYLGRFQISTESDARTATDSMPIAGEPAAASKLEQIAKLVDTAMKAWTASGRASVSDRVELIRPTLQ